MAHRLGFDKQLAGAFRVRFNRETIFTTASKGSANNRKALAVLMDAVARVC